MRLLELMLQAAMVDLIDNTHVVELTTRTENANQLLRWVYDLFVADPSRNDSKNISIKVNSFTFILYIMFMRKFL